jgi:hypothetical protein
VPTRDVNDPPGGGRTMRAAANVSHAFNFRRTIADFPLMIVARWLAMSRAVRASVDQGGNTDLRRTLIIAGVAALLTMTGQARAQANRTFVSGHGLDTNPCSLAAPCRSFAQALTQTNAGGEITVLDSAGYGTLTIDKSITITNPGGVEAGITTTASQTAVTINAQFARITLRGLTLQGGGVGQSGIQAHIPGPDTLNIIGCVIKDFTGAGIDLTGVNNVTIADSFAPNNGTGISSTLSAASVGHTTVTGNNIGISLDSTSAMLFDLFVNNNSTTGILLGTQGSYLLQNSTAVFNGVTDISNNSGLGVNNLIIMKNSLANQITGNHTSGGIH